MYENEIAYEIRDKACRSIKLGNGWYKSIFTKEYMTLDEYDKNMITGSIIADLGITFKEFVDTCISEKSESK